VDSWSVGVIVFAMFVLLRFNTCDIAEHSVYL
jgi:hypothetical protein